MSDETLIEWTDCTWNPILGCSPAKGSEQGGCKNCYATRQVHRMAGNPNAKIRAANEGLTVLTSNGPVWNGRVRLLPERLEQPLHWRRPRLIFVNSLSDLFHQGLTHAEIDRVVATMARANWHTFQVLTKRADRMRDYFAGKHGHFILEYEHVPARSVERLLPLHNVWLGVSVESRAVLRRIEYLRVIPAAVRFLSIEPLLEDLGPINLQGIHWVIVGGESGPGARPMHPDWVRSIRDQCIAAKVPFFMKQWGEWLPGMQDGARTDDGQVINSSDDTVRIGKKAAGRLLDGREWSEFPR